MYVLFSFPFSKSYSHNQGDSKISWKWLPSRTRSRWRKKWLPKRPQHWFFLDHSQWQIPRCKYHWLIYHSINQSTHNKKPEMYSSKIKEHFLTLLCRSTLVVGSGNTVYLVIAWNDVWPCFYWNTFSCYWTLGQHFLWRSFLFSITPKKPAATIPWMEWHLRRKSCVLWATLNIPSRTFTTSKRPVLSRSLDLVVFSLTMILDAILLGHDR